MDILLRKRRHRRPELLQQFSIGVARTLHHGRVVFYPLSISSVPSLRLEASAEASGQQSQLIMIQSSSDSRLFLASDARSYIYIYYSILKPPGEIQRNAMPNAGSPQYTVTPGKKQEVGTTIQNSL